VGKPKPEYKRAYETVLAAQAAAIELIKPGVNIRSVDTAAKKVIEKNGFEVFGHGTGHGIGLDVHELPVVSPNNNDYFAPGNVVTIEPGIYIPGKLGIRIEDDVLVTTNRHRIISRKIPKSFEHATL
jgi:Xaa-Pro aminopeptidase